MGLFTKKMGTVFLKETSSAEEYIDKLEALKGRAKGDINSRIEQQIAIAKYGLAGESNIKFELRNSGMDMYVLHDIYFEFENLSAQIDYLVFTRKRIYVIEYKNLIGNIEVNHKGDFIRNYELFGKKVREGIYSPITQNTRHLQIIKELTKAHRDNFLSKVMLEKNFDNIYKSLIVLANSKTVLNDKFAPREVKEQIVRVDQLIKKIKEMDAEVKSSTYNFKEMLELAQFYLSINQSERSDYAKKYEGFVQETGNDNVNKKLHNENKASDTIEEHDNICKEEISIPNYDELVKRLKTFRLEQSRKEKVKPYFIFNDSQMYDLINKKPQDKKDLLAVSGFGQVKVEKYGDAILKILDNKK